MGIIQINRIDQVAVAPEGLKRSQTITVGGVEINVVDDIPPCHKVAIKKIVKGDQVFKYGCPFGKASEDIEPGRWVHTHNVKTELEGILDYRYQPQFDHSLLEIKDQQTFQGYLRNDGQVGIRNYIFVIPTVVCANGTVKAITDKLNQLFPETENFDGFIPFPHAFGCSQAGADLLNTQQILSGLAHNPNAGGVLLVSLGCETNAFSVFNPVLGDVNQEAVKFLVMQEVDDEIDAGIRLGCELHKCVVGFQRSPAPLTKLVVAVNCGGSDGVSGLTANPLVGALTDILVNRGGSVVMTEVPEMLGAEQILMNRAQNEHVYNGIVGMINDYKNYFTRHGETANGNLTQGNQAGGLSTLEEKSLGCIQKAGRAIVTDVLATGERLRRPGLALLSGPGNDFAGITAQIAAGCNLVVFTTGRGTPTGFAAPTFRISSNTALYNKKRTWIDFNAGVLVEGVDLQRLAEELYQKVLSTANGEYRTCAELKKYFEIGILKDGITL